MPKGPRGEKRPADVIGTAVMVTKIATGEIEDARRDPGETVPRPEIGCASGQSCDILSEIRSGGAARRSTEPSTGFL